MIIQMPLKSADDVEILVKNGAGEFYCGIVPFEWNKKYGLEVPINCRSTYSWGNFKTFKELEKATEIAHSMNAKIMVTLNEHSYNKEQIKDILIICDKLHEIKVDGVIVCDIPLLIELKKRRYNFKIMLSCEANCTNQFAVDFYKQLNVNRIVFPRHMLIKEMEEIIKNNKNFEYEAFIYNEGCFFAGGHCYSIHHVNYSPLCRTCNYKLTTNNGKEDYDLFEKSKYQSFVKNSFRTKDGCTKCGLCSIKALQKSGVQYLKVAGRTAPIESSVIWLKTINEAISMSEVIDDPREFHEACKERFYGEMKSIICDQKIMCYYPEQY